MAALDSVTIGSGSIVFSTRKLLSGFAGHAMQVTRSDAATQNIDFVGEDLDTTTLLSFAGNLECHVTTWFNQAFAGTNDATASSYTNAPTIVAAGTPGILQTMPISGKAVMAFGANVNIVLSSAATVAPVTSSLANTVVSLGSLTGNQSWFGGAASGLALQTNGAATNYRALQIGVALLANAGSVPATATPLIMEFGYEGTAGTGQYQFWKNGFTDGNGTNSITLTGAIRVGNDANLSNLLTGGLIGEFCYFNNGPAFASGPGIATASRTTFEGNQNTYWQQVPVIVSPVTLMGAICL